MNQTKLIATIYKELLAVPYRHRTANEDRLIALIEQAVIDMNQGGKIVLLSPQD